ncbi:hypothetical protein K474DRAFT_1709148 [Panus rudis PR-1116 ss-1]|nr:hypothetical protein K474DRAFT_1709148 [Panus rudis PR-1116 ss-1]
MGPLVQLRGEMFLKAFFDIQQGYYKLWKRGTRHTKPDLSNLTFQQLRDPREESVGVILKWDLAVADTSSDSMIYNEHVVVPPRFIVLDLLWDRDHDDQVRHLYRYNHEATIWIATWVVLCYKDGEYVGNSHNERLALWCTGSYHEDCAVRKCAFLGTLSEQKPQEEWKKEWIVIHSLLSDLRRAMNARDDEWTVQRRIAEKQGRQWGPEEEDDPDGVLRAQWATIERIVAADPESLGYDILRYKPNLSIQKPLSLIESAKTTPTVGNARSSARYLKMPAPILMCPLAGVRPLMQLRGELFLKAFFDIQQGTFFYTNKARSTGPSIFELRILGLGYYKLWKRGTRHTKPDLLNLTFQRRPSDSGSCREIVGIILDWDLSVAGDSDSNDSTIYFESVVVPPRFVALDLLEDPDHDYQIRHLFRHNHEATIWIATWVVLCYKDGEYVGNSHNERLALWCTGNYGDCAVRKRAFLWDLSEQKPQEEWEKEWFIVESLLEQLYQRMNDRNTAKLQRRKTAKKLGIPYQKLVEKDDPNEVLRAQWVVLEDLAAEYPDFVEYVLRYKPDFLVEESAGTAVGSTEGRMSS